MENESRAAPAERRWTPVAAVNAGVAFALEIAMLVVLAYWGAHTGSGTPLKIVLAVAAPLTAIAV